MTYIHDLPLWSAYFDWPLAVITFTMLFLALMATGWLVRTHGGTSRSSGLVLSACLIFAGLISAGGADQLLQKLDCYIATDGVCHGFSNVSIWLKMVLSGLATTGLAFFAAIGCGIFANLALRPHSPPPETKRTP